MSSAIDNLHWRGHGELGVGASALQLTTSDIPCKMIKIIADPENTGYVALGLSSAVEMPDGGDGDRDIVAGLKLTAAQDSGWLPVNNVNLVYVIASATGQRITYVYLT